VISFDNIEFNKFCSFVSDNFPRLRAQKVTFFRCRAPVVALRRLFDDFKDVRMMCCEGQILPNWDDLETRGKTTDLFNCLSSLRFLEVHSFPSPGGVWGQSFSSIDFVPALSACVNLEELIIVMPDGLGKFLSPIDYVGTAADGGGKLPNLKRLGLWCGGEFTKEVLEDLMLPCWIPDAKNVRVNVKPFNVKNAVGDLMRQASFLKFVRRTSQPAIHPPGKKPRRRHAGVRC